MTTPIRARRGAALLLVAVPSLLWLAAPAVSAHPLGNFTVNRYDGLTVRPDRIDDLAVVDTAEIPTLQAKAAMDTDHDGALSPAEAAAHAHTACTDLARGIDATLGGDTGAAGGSGTAGGAGGARRSRALRFGLTDASFRLVPGQAGLDTGRLECRLSAPASPGRGDTIALATGVDSSRIGWHEITAHGDGVRIGSSDVPAVSVSRELRAYPADLLADPLDQRRTRLVLGSGPGAVAAVAPGTGWPSSWYAALDRRLGALTDHDRLTLPVGLLAVLMAMVLGAGHAALPGHGKTIMAAYLAGRQGRPRDAVTVAGTVTLTHTASVLVLGIALSVSSALVGEDVLAWLGTVSGIVITAAGLWLLPSAVRVFRARQAEHGHAGGAAHGSHGHGHEPGHEHGPGHGHGHGHAQGHGAEHQHPHPSSGPLVEVPEGAEGITQQSAATTVATTRVAVLDEREAPEHEHDREHGLEHGLEHDHGHDGHHSHHTDDHTAHEHPHRHGLFGHGHHHHSHSAGGTRKRGGLIGIGIAGGLVPSPSALVVLLGSIALGRTAFGVLLVVCYGLGMAATLAAAGLLLLTLRDRFPALSGGRWHAVGAWSGRLTPLGTALLILAVGVGTALRAMPL
ncbi:hypothetical protein [Streptomyces sp. NPDC008317]|uniref:hypothetical protein n=1 Tax=Streptomyces sp. NPDC008317 TaxID=3364827 RepID=UPI0036E533BC